MITFLLTLIVLILLFGASGVLRNAGGLILLVGISLIAGVFGLSAKAVEWAIYIFCFGGLLIYYGGRWYSRTQAAKRRQMLAQRRAELNIASQRIIEE